MPKCCITLSLLRICSCSQCFTQFSRIAFCPLGNLLEPSRLCLFACQVYKCTYNIYVASSLPYCSSTDLSRTQRGFLFFRIIVRVCCSCTLLLQLLENMLPAVVFSKTTTGWSSYEMWDGVAREHGPSVKCVRSVVLRTEVFQSGPVAVGYCLESVSRGVGNKGSRIFQKGSHVGDLRLELVHPLRFRGTASVRVCGTKSP